MWDTKRVISSNIFVETMVGPGLIYLAIRVKYPKILKE